VSGLRGSVGAVLRAVWLSVALSMAPLLTGCKGISDMTAPKPVETPVAAVTLSSEQFTLSEGATQALQALARDVDRRLLSDRSVQWSSSDNAVATVSATGLVTAVATGTARIAASIDGRSATALVTVVARSVASVQITPTAPSLLVGASVQLSAATLDLNGAPLTGRTVFWGTSDAAIAVVDVTGFVTAIAPGAATITATSESRSAAVGVTVAAVPVAAVQVTPARDSIVIGQSTQLTATARDSTGAALNGRLIAWSSSASTVATVSSTGLVVGVTAGTVTITASSEGRSSASIIVVRPRPVGAVIVSPEQSSVTVGDKIQLTVQVTDNNGNLLTGRPISYASSNVSVAQVTATGLVTAAAPGTATITVSSEGKVGTATVTVTASPIASLRITPNAVTVIVGGTTRLAAAALDAGGNVLAQRPVTWTSGAPSVASVAPDGTVTAISAGTALIFASAEGRMTSATITVTTLAPTSIVVTPGVASVIVGENRDLTAELRNAAGQAIVGRTVQWTSSNNAVAIVSSAGRVRGVTPGTTRIDATVDGVVGSSAITVVPVPVASVSVNLAAATLLVGQTTQATAVARDAAGNVLTGRVVAWSSANTAIATVSGTGLVTAVALGSAAIRATVEGIQGSSTLTVGVGAAASMAAVSVVTQSAAAGTAVAAPPSVRVRDIAGSPVSGVNVTFTLTAGAGSTTPASPATVATNASGVATLTTWTLGNVVGANTVSAAVSGLTGSPVVFNATGVAGAASIIAANSVVTQSATAGTAVGAPPSVKVTDAVGNAVSGVVVTFAVTAGGGTISSASATTNAGGIATLASWTLGALVGTNTVTATATGLTGSPVLFNATGTVGAAAIIVANSALSQSGTASSAVATPPSVRVTDIGGNPVSGVNVTFTVTAGGGTTSPASPAVVATNASGVATITSWTLGAVAGANALTAGATGLTGSPITFTATAVAGAPTTIAASSVITQSAIAGSAVSAAPSVRVTDATGNGVPGVTVTFAVTGGGGSITPTTVSTNATGFATLTSWTLGTVAGPNSVTATVAGLAGSPVTFNATGLVGPDALLSITTQPGGASIGAPFTTQPVVEIRDANGNLTASSATVTVAIASGGGTLGGTTTVTAVNGVATFTNLSLSNTGAHTLTFTATGLTSVTSASFIVAAGPPTNIAANSAIAQTANAGTAVAAAPSVLVTDAFGNPVAGVNVTFAVTAGGGVITPTTVATNALGIATVTSWTLGAVAGANSVTATVAGLSGSPVAFNAVGQVGPAAAIVATSATTQSAPFSSAVTAPPAVQVRDLFGNGVSGVSVTFTVTAGAGVIAPASPAVVVTDANGNAALTTWTLGASLGTNTVTAAAAGLTGSPVSFNATATAGAPTTIAANSVTTQSAIAGTAVAAPPSVLVTDAGNNPVAGVSVTFAVTAGGGAISPASPATVSTNASGIATLTSWTLGATVGANSVTASVAGLAGSPVTFTATGTVGPAAALAISTQPAGAVTGVAFTTQPVVQIRDANGNLTASAATVTVALASGSGTLGGTTTVTAVNGVATFTDLLITGVGAHTLTFTSTGVSSVTSASLSVAAGAPTQLTIGTEPAGAVSGLPFTTQPVVQIRDAGGNLTTSTASVTATIATGTGTLAGTVTVNAVNGVATFTTLQLNGSGAHTLTFSSTGLTSATSTSIGVTQSPASLSIQTQPAGAVTGAAFTTQPVVRVLDNAGLVVTTGPGATLSIAATINSGSGTLSGTVSEAAVNGVTTFTTLAITGFGPHTLQFATSTPSLSVNSAALSVAAGPPTTIASNSATPQTANAGTAVAAPPSVKVTDAGGNPVAGVNVVFAVTSGGGATSPASPATVATNALGVATLTSWTLGATAGANTLTATAVGLTGSPVLFSATGIVGPAADVIITTQPSGAVSGSALTTQPVVEIRDAFGNLTTSSTVVTASLFSGSGTLTGTLTATAVNGVATFTNVQVDGLGAHAISFAAAGLTSATSAVFQVVAGAPTQLVVVTQPSNGVSSLPLTTQPVIEVRDATGNITTSNAPISAAVASGVGTLSGTTSVNASNGTASFNDLAITGTGTFTLTFTSAGLTSATSSSFTVTGGGPTTIAANSALTQSATAGTAVTAAPSVKVTDAGNAPVSGVNVTFTVTSGGGSITPASPATVVTDAAGLATLTGWTLGTTAGANTVAASVAGLSGNPVTFTATGTAGAASQLTMGTQPGGSVSGVALTTQPVVEIRDANGNLTTSTLAVTAVIFTGSGTIAGTATVNAVNGVATFTDLQVDGFGAVTLRFTATGVSAVTSASFTVTQVPASLVIQTQPAGATASVAFTTQPVVHILDNAGLIITSGAGATAQVTVTVETGAGAVSGTTTVTAANGVATFTDLVLSLAGAHTLKFSIASPALSVISASFTVN
jgi:uncharacterized protein YjdB